MKNNYSILHGLIGNKPAKLPALFCFIFLFALLTPALAQRKAIAKAVIKQDTSAYARQKRLKKLNRASQVTTTSPKQTGNNHFSTALATATSSGCFIAADDSYTTLPVTDDDSSDEIDLPFTFDLYGAQYTSLFINNNGNVTFGSSIQQYTPDGFPIYTPMVAPFWADVDTRAAGVVQYKISPTNIIVTWTGVGYYDEETDKLNTFQLILTNGQDPLIGVGSNVAFYYGDMEWTAGDVSGGTDGLGGSPATVGINKGDGTNYVQVGRFDEAGTGYGGPGSTTNGVGYLSGKCFTFNVGSADTTNIPPSVSGLPANNTISLKVGDTVTISPQFIGPEVNQNVTTTLDDGGLCNVTSDITNGAVSTATITIIGAGCNTGTHTITLTATDDGTPPETTTVDLTVIVSKLDQTITFDPIPDHTFGDPPFAINATATSGLPVTFTVLSGPATVSGDVVTLTGAGTVVIEADQGGDDSYNAAPPVTQTFNVGKSDQTITFPPIPTKAYNDPDFDPGATASSGLPVTYTSSNTAVAIIVGGLVQIVGVGTSTITASQDGDDDYNAAPDVSQLLTVVKADQTITFPPIPVQTLGNPDFDPGATASSGLAVTYTSSNSAVATIVGGLIHITGAGTSLITASQPGDNNYNAAADVSQTLTVNSNKASQTITFNAIASRTYGAADFSPGATASSGLAVSYTSSTPAVATILNGNIHITGVGSTTITANQAGNANFFAASPVSQTFTVTKAPLTITADNKTKVQGAANPTLTVTYTGFVYGETPAVLTTLPAVGTTATTTSPVGTYPITASGAAAANYTISYIAGTLTINGTGSSDASLSNLVLSNGTLSPAFALGTLNYSTSVGYNLQTMTVTPYATAAGATIKVNGITVASGSPSGYLTLVPGANAVNIVVTAADGTTTETYVLTVNEAHSANNNLAALSVNTGTFSPAFAPATTSYTESVPYITSQIKVTPTVADPTATVKVNGVSVTSGTASAPVTLFVGVNTITVAVTAANSSVKNYIISITRAPSSNATLTNIVLSNSTISPAFVSTTLNYTATVPYLTTSTTLTPTAGNNSATIKVNGITVATNTVSGPIALKLGANVITIVVTAQDGVTMQTYTVTVIRSPASTVATLANITLNKGAVSPAFASATTSYTVTETNSTSSVSVSPTATDPTAFITVNGTHVASGGSSTAIALAVGSNTITILVTAQDGTTTDTYTLNVIRPSTNATLASLAINAGTLTPTFVSATKSYTASVAYINSSVKLTPTVTVAGATVTINGTSVASGAQSGFLILKVGANTITIVVTAQDGITTNTYTVVVTRAAPSTNDNLSGLAISKGTLSPAFAAGTTSYSATETNGTTSVTLTPSVADATATITINGTAVISGRASWAIALAVGNNAIPVVVTAQDGVTKQTYTVNVLRVSTNATLASLAINAGTLTPTFASATKSYTASVAYINSSVKLTPTVTVAGATVTINGTAVASGTQSGFLILKVGANTITTVVTAQDGITTNTYTLVVTRAAPSTNDNLSALAISKGTLSPAFSGGTISYSVTETNGTTSVTLTPTTADATATITVNGIATISGRASGAIALAVGNNAIPVVVTAQDGVTKQTYTVNVLRVSTNAKLSALTVSSGTLTPVFSGATTAYTVSVPNATSSITVTPTAAVAGSAITVNGIPVTSGTASAAIALAVGANKVNVLVTAQDGATTIAYAITVTRAPSTNAGLAAITLSSGTLNPVFATATKSYTATVPAGTATITLTPTLADATASVTVNGVAVSSGSPSGNITLAVGANVITTIVTAQDGATTATYTVTVTRPLSNNANLANITVSKGSITPAFNASTTSYTDMVTNGTTSITLTPTLADPTATVTVNGVTISSGNASGAITLGIGSNPISIVVTAQDGTTMVTTTVTVIRPSTNAKLSSLTLSSGTLTPGFDTNVASYSASVTNATSSVTVTPTAAVAGATIKVNGTTVVSGSASPAIALSVGSNTISILIIAQDGASTATYTITVTRAAASNNTVYLPVSVSKPGEGLLLAEDGLLVHQGISPNGDGIDDFLQIDNISQYPDNNIRIMDRNGLLVYEAKGYDNARKIFDGHSNKNGRMQLPGTYFYALDYTVNGSVKHKTGFLVLKY